MVDSNLCKIAEMATGEDVPIRKKLMVAGTFCTIKDVSEELVGTNEAYRDVKREWPLHEGVTSSNSKNSTRDESCYVREKESKSQTSNKKVTAIENNEKENKLNKNDLSSCVSNTIEVQDGLSKGEPVDVKHSKPRVTEKRSHSQVSLEDDSNSQTSKRQTINKKVTAIETNEKENMLNENNLNSCGSNTIEVQDGLSKGEPGDVKRSKPRVKDKEKQSQSQVSLEDDSNSLPVTKIMETRELDKDEEEFEMEQLLTFSVKNFRENVQGPEGYSLLADFAILAARRVGGNSVDVIAEYLEAGGTPMEIVQQLQTDNYGNFDRPELPCIIFKILHILILRCVKEKPELRLNCESTCRVLLNNHLLTIKKMMTERSSGPYLKTALNILTCIVSVSPVFGMDILMNFNFTPELLKVLTRTGMMGEHMPVRLCFTHFLVACLVHNNVPLIQAVLQKPGLLTSIFQGLDLVKAETVHLIATTVQIHIVQNRHIKKSLKRLVFNTNTIKMLLKAFSWTGPKTSFRKVGRTPDEVNHKLKDMVTNAVKKLLMVLCTSHKLGIVFHDPTMGTSDKKYNSLMYSVLKETPRPWENPHIADVVVATLVSCPDLLRVVLKNANAYLQPRISTNWIQCMDFLKRIIKYMDPERCLKPNIKMLPLSNLKSIVLLLCAPVFVLRPLSGKMVSYETLTVRLEVSKLLLAMLKNLQRYVVSLDRWGVLDETNRNDFISTVAKPFPVVNFLMDAWEPMTILQAKEYDSTATIRGAGVSLYKYLLINLDILMLHCQFCYTPPPEPSSGVPLKVDLPMLLKTVELVGEEFEIALLQIKSIHVAVEVDKENFVKSKYIFSRSTTLLLQRLCHNSPTISELALSVVTKIFLLTGVFENLVGEENIWIHCYRCLLDQKMRGYVSTLLISSIIYVNEHPEKFESITKMKEAPTMKEQSEVSKGRPRTNVVVSSPGPLLPGLLMVLKSNNVPACKFNVFLEPVTIHIINSLPSSTTLRKIMEDEFVSKIISNYILCSNMDNDDTPYKLQSLFGTASLEYKLSLFLSGKSHHRSFLEALEIETIMEHTPFKDTDSMEGAGMPLRNDRLNPVNAVHLVLLFNFALYHFAKMVSDRKLSLSLLARYEDTFTSVLELLKKSSCTSREVLITLNNETYDLQCSRKLLSHPVLLGASSIFNKFQNNARFQKKLTLDMMLRLVHWAKENYPVSIHRDLLQGFKEMIVGHLTTKPIGILHRKIKSVLRYTENYRRVVELIDICDIDYNDIIMLLTTLFSKNLAHKILVETNTCKIPTHLSVWGDLVGYLLGRVVTLRLQDRSNCGDVPRMLMDSIAKSYVLLRKCATVDLTSLEDNLRKYIEHFPHSQKSFGSKVIKMILKTRFKLKSAFRLGKLLLSRNVKLQQIFLKAAKIENDDLFKIHESVFLDYLSVVDCEMPKNLKLLQSVYNHYEHDIVVAIKSPHKAKQWIVTNLSVVTGLMNKFLTIETCCEVYKYIDSHESSIYCHGIHQFHIVLLDVVYFKFQSFNVRKVFNPIFRLVNVLLGGVVYATKKDIHKLTLLCKCLQRCFENADNSSHWPKLKDHPDWSTFRLQTLKLGLQLPTKEYSATVLLETLSLIYQAVYKDDSSDEEASLMFEMTLSHSGFLTTMLGNTRQKLALVRLLNVFVSKAPKIMSSKHIPVLLGAYGATLSRTDQLILRLINTYFTNNVSLQQSQPYLWGEAAVNYYCVKTKEATSLWKYPTMIQVISLLKMEIVENTIRKYPLDRTNFEEYKDCPNLYDPVFFLSLFSQLLAPESIVQPHKFTHTGGLALTLASLANNSFEMRAMAYNVLSRYYFHLEASNGRDREWWMQFLCAIRNGIAELGEEGVQLACVVSTFLARASLVISQPLHPLYKPLEKFILAKPAMNLNTIPELYILFNSKDLKSRDHRHFMLRVLRDGLRLDYDWNLAMKCVLFQMLQTFYSSVVAEDDAESKVLIIEVINSALQLHGGAKYLTFSYGVLSWLQHVIRKMTNRDHQLAVAVIQLMTSLWNKTAGAPNPCGLFLICKGFLISNLSLMLARIALKLPSIMSLNELMMYLQILEKVSGVECMLTSDCLLALISFCTNLLGSLEDLEDMVKFGCKFIAKYVETSKSNNDINKVRSCLKRIIILWHKKGRGREAIRYEQKRMEKKLAKTKLEVKKKLKALSKTQKTGTTQESPQKQKKTERKESQLI